MSLPIRARWRKGFGERDICAERRREERNERGIDAEDEAHWFSGLLARAFAQACGGSAIRGLEDWAIAAAFAFMKAVSAR